MNEQEKSAVVFSFFLFIFVIANLGNFFDVTTPIYIQAVREQNPGAFVMPLLYYLGSPVYFLLGDGAFSFLALMFLVCTIYFMLKFFEEFGLEKWLILLTFGIFSRWVPVANFFNRDNLMLALASAFSFYLFRFMYKKDARALGFQAVIVFLMLLTKAVGVVFLVIFLVEILVFYRKRLDFFPLVLPFGEHYSNLVGGIVFLPLVTVAGLASTLANPFFGLNIFGFLHKRESLLQLFIVLITVLSVGVLAAQGHDIGRILRYTVPFIPLNLFCVAYSLKTIQGKRWLKVLFALGLAKAASGFFYFDAVWKVLL